MGISLVQRNGNLFEREEEGEGSRGKELLIDQPSWEKNRKEKKKEKRSNSPCRGNSKFERGRKTKGKRHKASDCSFGGGCSFIKGINTICLLTKQLWWFETLLPGGCSLPSSVGGYPAQLPPAERIAVGSPLPFGCWAAWVWLLVMMSLSLSLIRSGSRTRSIKQMGSMNSHEGCGTSR